MPVNTCIWDDRGISRRSARHAICTSWFGLPTRKIFGNFPSYLQDGVEIISPQLFFRLLEKEGGGGRSICVGPSQHAKVDLKSLIVSVIPIYSFSDTINLFWFLFFS